MNEVDLNTYVEWDDFSRIVWLDCIFENLDLLRKVFGSWNFENCKFNNLSFQKCQFSNCNFQNCQIIKSRIENYQISKTSKLIKKTPTRLQDAF